MTSSTDTPPRAAGPVTAAADAAVPGVAGRAGAHRRTRPHRRLLRGVLAASLSWCS